MSDGTLYGHGQDADIPAGMTVEYRSNRPEVVSVDPDGTIHTRGAGVATVTAIVRHNGTERTTDFAIRVQEDHRRRPEPQPLTSPGERPLARAPELLRRARTSERKPDRRG